MLKDLVYLGVDLLPEHLELTHLQQVSKIEQSFHLEDEQLSRKDRIEQFNFNSKSIQVEPKIHLRFVQNLLAEETLAQDEVGVGKVGKRLQQDLHDDVHLVRHLHVHYNLKGEVASNQLSKKMGLVRQNLTYHTVLLLILHIRVGWVELVEFQQGQVCLQVVTF